MSFNNTGCNLTSYDGQVGQILMFIVYRVFDFVYLTVGLSGNILLLIAFWKQSKTECAYMYQVIFTISKALEIFWFGIFLLAYYWLGSSFIGVDWFMQSYFLMYTFKCLGFGFHYSLMMCSLLLAVAMAADRVFAIAKPLVHKNLDHRRHQILASILCLALGFLGGSLFFYSMRIHWDDEGHRYLAELDENLYHSNLGYVLFFVNITIRISAVLLLIILYLIMVVALRKHVRRVSSKLRVNQKLESSKRSAEKALLWLNTYHACMMLLNQLPHVIWHFLYYLEPFTYHYNCMGRIIGTVCDACVLVTDTFDFFVVVSINKRMRTLVWNIFPKWCRRKCGEMKNERDVVTSDSRH